MNNFAKDKSHHGTFIIIKLTLTRSNNSSMKYASINKHLIMVISMLNVIQNSDIQETSEPIIVGQYTPTITCEWQILHIIIKQFLYKKNIPHYGAY